MQLTINVIKAILTHDTQIGSKMDPFVVLKMGKQSKKSQTLQEAGEMPQFNYTETFIIKPSYENLHLIVYDQDLAVDDLVGEVTIDLKPILIQPYTEKKWYSLKYEYQKKLKPAGKIMLQFTCRKNGSLQSMTKQEVKQLIKPKIHPIGVAPQHIGKGKLYGMETDNFQRTIPEYERRLGSSQSQRGPGNMTVYSFRNNSIRNGNNHLGHHLNGLTTTTHTQKVINSSVSSSNASSGCFAPSYNGNPIPAGYYGFNSNQHLHNSALNSNNIYVTYQQPQNQSRVSNSIAYPLTKGQYRMGSPNCLDRC